MNNITGCNQPSCNVTECDQAPKAKKMRTDVHGTCCTSTLSDILSSGNVEEDVKVSLEAASVNSLSNAEQRRSLEDGVNAEEYVEGSLAAGSSIDNTQDSTRGSNVKGTF
jgi:hypothetical protein